VSSSGEPSVEMVNNQLVPVLSLLHAVSPSGKAAAATFDDQMCTGVASLP